MIKILLSDDKEYILETLEMIIEEYIPNCIIYKSTSGNQCIELAKKYKPDLIIIDYFMPKLNGCEICKIIKNDYEIKYIPIIFITGEKISLEERIDGLNIGADAFVFKPIEDVGEFIAQINVMLRIKNMEDKLRENQELLSSKYSKLFENMMDGFALHEMVLDDNGNPIDYIYMEINESFKKQVGIEKIVGKSVLELFPGMDRDWIDIYGKVALNGEEIRFERYFKPLNKWFSITTFSPIKNFFVTISSDITEKKESSEQLRILVSKLNEEKNRAEKSDRLKSSFLANISHEIRTPLNSIVGFSRLLLMVGRGERRKYVNIIEKNSEMLLNLIDDIIDLSKIESRQIKLRNDRCNLLGIINEVHMSNTSKDDVKFYVDEGLTNTVIYTDEFRLKQILNNLITNSIKFTDDGHVKIGYKLEPKNILFYVEDTGMGISEKDKDYVFERFTQLNEKDNREYGGTGLGLSICKKIVDILGGKIWFESEVGKGTTFYFTIPSDYVQKINNEYDRIKKQQKKKYNWKGRKILIIDDDDYSSMLISRILEKTNVQISSVESAIEALVMIDKEKFDAILSDIKLSDMNGFELVKRIKIKTNIPVIAQTAYAMMDKRSEAIESGFDDYLIKPIDTYKLINTLSKYFD